MSDLPRPLPGDAPAEPDPMLGRVLADRYRVESLIARGGMARVYRARDTRLERDVAIKILAPPYADDPEFARRFLDEARAAASLSHPSLVHVYDSGSDGAANYIVMELLDRHRTLRSELEWRGRLPYDEVLRIGRELLAGLRAVHERGLVHCDVKAGNVMLGPGPAKLIDFGIARTPHEALDGEKSIGSLAVMSPEQLHGEALTPASDLFSLGVVLYEALTGHVPFPGRTPEEVSAAHGRGVRPPSTVVEGIPARLDEAVLQALRPDPRSRFRSAEAMAVALGAAGDEIATARDEETRVHRAPGGGYVPPAMPSPAPQPQRAREPDRTSAGPPGGRRRAPARRAGGGGLGRTIGTLLILAAAGLVLVLVVLPLLQLSPGADTGTGGSPAATTPPPAPTVVAGVVPDTVGRPTAEAIEMARAAGLDWTVRCNEDQTQPAGIIDQEPPAGTPVAPGAPFTMYSARIADCR